MDVHIYADGDGIHTVDRSTPGMVSSVSNVTAAELLEAIKRCRTYTPPKRDT